MFIIKNWEFILFIKFWIFFFLFFWKELRKFFYIVFIFIVFSIDSNITIRF